MPIHRENRRIVSFPKQSAIHRTAWVASPNRTERPYILP